MIHYINIKKLHPHPNNPRKNLGDLFGLMASIQESGIEVPIIVVPGTGDKTDEYTIVEGHRRHAAALKLDITEIPSIIADYDEITQLAKMIEINNHRKDIDKVDEAEHYQLMLDLGATYKEIKKKTNVSEPVIRSRVKMLETFGREALEKVQDRPIKFEDYDKLYQIEGKELRDKVLESIGTNNFNQELQRAISAEKTEKLKAQIIEKLSAFADELETRQTDFKPVRYFANSESGLDSVVDFGRPDEANTREYAFVVENWGVQLYKQILESDQAAEPEAPKKNKIRSRAP